MQNISLSVHDIVDLLLRKGDIDNRFFNTASMQEGTKLHAWYQSIQTSNYQAEYFLHHVFTLDNYQLDVSGRADGVIVDELNLVTIDEIKTTNEEIEKFREDNLEWHLGQGIVYAYLYALDNDLKRINVQMTYISQIDKKIKKFMYFYTFEDVEKYVLDLLNQYAKYLDELNEYFVKRQESLEKMTFPFNNVRGGQQELMDFCSDVINKGEIGYLEAKTGIGKTISTIYPSLKALGEKKMDKLFYLTAKNSVKQVAFDTLKILENQGLEIKGAVITSKEKVCINLQKGHCNPDECPYAKGYYDKINNVVLTALKRQNLFNFEDILSLANEFDICPFEMQLDLLTHMDVIIGDYNYLFDPHARLARFFETLNNRSYLLLVDEAHNLPSRVRGMFSREFNLKDLDLASDSLKESKGKHSKTVIACIKKIKDFFETISDNELTDQRERIKEVSEVNSDLLDLLEIFIQEGKRYLKDSKKVDDGFLDLYFLAQDITNLPSSDPRWCYFYKFSPFSSKCQSFNISCLDSRDLIKDSLLYFKGGLMFSATLTPRDYFINLLGGNSKSPLLFLPSPFDQDNQLIVVDPLISTKYRDRDASLRNLCNTILYAVLQKKGNYFVFFPSFEYLEKARKMFVQFDFVDCYFQTSQMNENERKEFLAHFTTNPQRTTLGFIVLGGVFSEGIDLVDDRLIGAIIVSIGLPKVSYLVNRINQYYQDIDPEEAYNYSYTYPGLSKVIQAAGRVIRTENDKGVILFIDERYASPIYKKNFEEMYGKYDTLRHSEDIQILAKNFWKRHKDE